MAESAIAATDAEPTIGAAPAWYPFPELAAPLERLDRECAGLDADVRQVIREAAATFDALVAETEQQFGRLRQAYRVTADLDDEQTARVLRGIRGRLDATVGSDLRGSRGEPVSA